MNEKILLLPGINGTELLRSMAIYGRATIGLRILNGPQLAETALMRSGHTVEGQVIRDNGAAAIIASFLRQVSYYRSSVYSDAEHFARKLMELRSLILDQEEETLREMLPEGEFPEKNEAVLEVYHMYMARLRERGLTDRIGVMRQAVQSGARLDAGPRGAGCELLTVSEAPLSPLEEKLAETVSGGNVIRTSLWELFGKDAGEIHIATYEEGYGAINEVKGILARILKEEIPFDQCTIAAADPAKYVRIFRDLSLEYGFDITFGCGLPLADTKPAELLGAYDVWDSTGWHGIFALERMIFAESFDTEKLLEKAGCDRRKLHEAVQVAGALRLDGNGAENARKLAEFPKQKDTVLPVVKVIAKVLEAGPAELLREYTSCSEGDLFSRAAVQVLANELEICRTFGGGSPEEMIPVLLRKGYYREVSRGGALHITTIRDAQATMRKHLFLCGMDSSVFPGSAAEDHILLDSDLEMFGGTAYTSAARIERKKKELEDLLRLAGSLGTVCHLSWSGFDLAELKELNPSSSVYEIFREDRGADVTSEDLEAIRGKAGFFRDVFRPSEGLARNHVEGMQKPYVRQLPEIRYQPKEQYSPSAIGEFFACGKRFELNRMAGLYLEEADDPLVVISPADLGTLAHLVMEKKLSAEELFDDFLKTQPPVDKQRAIRERRDFVEMMERAVREDPDNEILLAEEQLEADCFGVPVYGRPDRIEKDAEGRNIVVDFKTGNHIAHEKDDINTCLQAVLYAYMAEAAGIPVDHCEYRYLRNSRTISCKYDADMKEKLQQLMEYFKEAVAEGRYEYGDKENCRYCQYGHLCGRED